MEVKRTKEALEEVLEEDMAEEAELEEELHDELEKADIIEEEIEVLEGN